MPNPWEMNWSGGAATAETPPWEQTYTDAPVAAQPAAVLEPVPGYLKLAARADTGVRKAGLNLMRMVDAASEFMGLPDAAEMLGAQGYADAVRSNLKYYNEREAQLSQQDRALDDNSIAGQLVEGTARAFTELPAQIGPAALLSRGGNALKIAAGTAGGMGALSSYGQDKGDGRSDLEAIPYALMSGAITALTTKAFGNTGVESIFRDKAAGTLRQKLLAAMKDVGMEAAEESVDQVQQDLLERAARNPDKTAADTVRDVLLAGAMGGLVGGGVSMATLARGIRAKQQTEAAKLEAELAESRGSRVESQPVAPVAADAGQTPEQRLTALMNSALTDAGLREAPATIESGGSPVERFIYEQKAVRKVSSGQGSSDSALNTENLKLETAPEPKPWEMEYAGGEMPAESGKFEVGSVKAEQPKATTENTEAGEKPVPVEVSTAATVWRKAEKRLRRAQRQDPPDLEAAREAREEAEIDFRMLAEKNNISQRQFDELRAEATATETQRLIDEAKDTNVSNTVVDNGNSGRRVAVDDSNLVKSSAPAARPISTVIPKTIIELRDALAEGKPIGGVFASDGNDVYYSPMKVKPGQEPGLMLREGKGEWIKVNRGFGGEATPEQLTARLEVAQMLGYNDVPGYPGEWMDARDLGARTKEQIESAKSRVAEKQKTEAEAVAYMKKFSDDSRKRWVEAIGRGEYVPLESAKTFKLEPELQQAGFTKGEYFYEKPKAAAKAKSPAGANGLEAWADKTLAKDPRSRTRAGLDPIEEAQRLAAVAVKGSYIIARGVRDFAAWSAEMIRQLPELANATAEHLKALYNRSVDIAEGRDPEIGLSIRGMKVKADTSLSDQVQEAVDAAYLKRISGDDVAEAKRLIEAAGGPEAAASELLQGLWKSVDMPVQVKAMGEMMAGLAKLEQHATVAGDTARANDLADLQVRVANHSQKMATTPAQWLQAFASLYANYSPAAWLKEWRNAVSEGRRVRIEKATRRKARETDTGQARDIAEGVAEGIKTDAPQVAEAIRNAFGGRTDAPNKPLVEVVQEIFNQKPEQARKTAKKIQDFYEREVEKFKRKHKIPEFTPEDQRQILAEAKALEKFPKDSLQRREAVLKLLDSLHRRKGFEWWELPVAFWYANTLSGPTTHAKNILGNSINLSMEAGLQTLLKPTNLPTILESLGRSLSVGAREAASIMVTGHDTAARHGDKFELRRNPMELQSGALDKILLPWKLVGRILRAEDAVFFNAGQELRAAILAKHKAGGDTAAMREAMGWTAEARTKAEAQATAEGVTGWNYQRRVNEIIEQGRSNELMNAARDFGYDVTFNNDPYGVLGAFTSAVNRGFEYAPILKPFILPFTRIVANVTNSSLNWTPVGTYRALRAQRRLNWLGRAENSGKLYGREINDPLAIRDAHARALIGTAAVIGLTAAAIKNVFDDDPEFLITGAGPANKDQRDALKAAGWIPYSVKVGGRYYSYQDKPPQVALSIIGHYLDAIRYKNLDREDALNRAAYALNGSAQVLLNSSWLQGLSGLFNQANRDSVKGGYKGIVSQAAKTGSGFVVPSALKQLDRFFDPQQYSPQDVQGMLLAQIPWARRNGHPDLNIFGQPVSAPTSKIFWSKVEGDKLTRALAGQRVFPGMPTQGELTPEEHYKLVQYRGPILREMLVDSIENWLGAPRLLAQDEVNRVSARATEQAKRDLGLDEINKERREVLKLKTK